MSMWVEARVVELSNLRMRAAQGRAARLRSARSRRSRRASTCQRFSEVMARLMGPAGQVGFDYDATLHGDEEKIALQPHMVVV